MSLENPDRTPVAKELFTHCTKEKHNTWHIVMFHNAQGIVDKVKCKSCGSEHKYKPQALQKSKPSAAATTLLRRIPSAPKPSSTSSSTSQNMEEIWLEGVKKWGEKVVLTYDPTKSFKQGDVFTHEVFGKGVVQARRENKVEVLFRNGMKLLPSPRP